MKRLTPICWGGLVLLGVMTGRGQEKLKPDQPRMVLNTEAPSNTVQTLAFSPDSTRLYAAGFDKSVFAWDLSEGVLIKGLKTTFAQMLRWEVSRGQRGVIYTIATPSQGRELALGGISARDGSGNIIIYDTAADVVRMVLHANNPIKNYQGHSNAVVAVAWSPDKTRLASTSIDGELRVWSLQNQQSALLRPKKERPGVDPEAKNDQVHPVLFLSNEILLAATPRSPDGKQWGVDIYNLANPAQPTPLAQAHPYGCTALARDPQSDRWLSAAGNGQVFLWQGLTPTPIATVRAPQPDSVVNAVGFAGEGLMAMLTRPLDGIAWIELHAAAGLIDRKQIRRVEDNIGCLAISPNLRWLATSGEDDSPVLVFELRDAAGKPVGKPLSTGNPTAILALGRDVGKVAFAADGSYRLGFGPATNPQFLTKDGHIHNDYGVIDRSFDLDQGALAQEQPDPKRWLPPHRLAGAWGITSFKGQPWRLQIWNGQRPASTITLNRDRQGSIVSYCWLGLRDEQPPRIAIGTDHQNGVFVYEVLPQGECPLVRYYRDHTGLVASLSMSSDGKYLASGSADHTIKLWSLEGIYDSPPHFAPGRGWGASIERQGPHLAITSVMPQGIAARRGLRKGDVITLVRTAAGADATPDTMLARLQSLPLWETAVLDIVRGPERLVGDNGILLVPAWEPMATLYVDEADEWVLATPQGFYEASTSGDSLIGWQINKGVDQKPEFFLANQFRDKLENPKLLREMFRLGFLQSAVGSLKLALESGDVQGYLYNLTAAGVRVAVQRPLDAQQFSAGEPIEAEAIITYPAGRNPQEFRVRAYVNGAIYEPASQTPLSALQEQVRFQIKEFDPLNSLTIKVEERGKNVPQFDSDKVYFRAAAPSSGKAQLHVVTLAASQYATPLQNLQFTVSDAQQMSRRLLDAGKGLYEPCDWGALLEADITAENLAKLAARIKAAIQGPRDLLVVFVAGHGEIVDGDYYFVPGGVDLSDRAAIQRLGVKWSGIASLADVPCRRMFLLETCNSGNVTSQEESRPILRLLTKENPIVLTASGINEKAFGYDGQGAFTRHSLKALEEGDINQDGLIAAPEFVSYIRAKVPPSVQSYGAQNPRVYPQNLADFELVPVGRKLVALPAAGGRN